MWHAIEILYNTHSLNMLLCRFNKHWQFIYNIFLLLLLFFLNIHVRTRILVYKKIKFFFVAQSNANRIHNEFSISIGPQEISGGSIKL